MTLVGGIRLSNKGFKAESLMPEVFTNLTIGVNLVPSIILRITNNKINNT